FSSSRRHTRSKRDWSSDVCSSDLGDPIPDAAGTVAVDGDQFLTDTAPGTEVRVTRVSDRSSELLRYFQSLGLAVGTALRVDQVNTAADTVHITVDGAAGHLSGLRASAS